MTRAEHLAWAKARALEYLELGDSQNALASIISDVSKHDETRQLLEAPDYTMRAVFAMLFPREENVRAFIARFN